MHLQSILKLSAGAVFFTGALAAPQMPNYNIIWADDFEGNAGSQVDQSKWNYETPSQNANDEKQQYTDSAANGGLTGRGTLQITPLRSFSGQWTSARLASWSSFTCESGKKMVVQAELKLGGAPADQQKGIWPAFWALGKSRNTGTPWPKCGEWDIMELINGGSVNVGTIHCDQCGGKPLAGSINFDRSAWHTFAIKIDRSASTWEAQTIRWYVDGNNFYTVTGAQVGVYDDWVALARSPFYILLNVAVGGSYPGDPDAHTIVGTQVGMEVRYVAVYAST